MSSQCILRPIIAALAGATVSAVSFLGAVLVVVVGIPVADCLIGLLMSRRRRAAALRIRSAAAENRVFRRASRIVILVLATLLVLIFLGFDLVASAQDRLGAWLARLVFDVGVVVLVAYVFWEARHRRHQPKARGGNARSMLTAQST